MKNVDIEIYISNLINFFEKNPNDLLVLIGDLQKDEFYVKLKKRANKIAGSLYKFMLKIILSMLLLHLQFLYHLIFQFYCKNFY